MTTDQKRIEELTEWCRNKPEEAARRILTAEDIDSHRRPWKYLSAERKREALKAALDYGLLS